MVDFKNISEYFVPRPNVWTCFGSAEDFDKLPIEHRDQIKFLSEEAVNFLFEFLDNSKMVDNRFNTKPLPFKENYFQTIETCLIHDNDKLKKWLYQRRLPFKQEVFVLYNSNESFIATWKMVVKYAPLLVDRYEDLWIFDQTLNWGLYKYHEDQEVYFGKDNIYNPDEAFQKMNELSELKKLYPNLRFPY